LEEQGPPRVGSGIEVDGDDLAAGKALCRDTLSVEPRRQDERGEAGGAEEASS
jgi:hypothetical protein